jgi:hypothetical protein
MVFKLVKSTTELKAGDILRSGYGLWYKVLQVDTTGAVVRQLGKDTNVLFTDNQLRRDAYSRIMLSDNYED